MIISVDGLVTRASWQYLPANRSLIINGSNNQSYMMRPFFQDKNLFTLQLDGTHEFSFLVNEKQASDFPVKTLSDLKQYLENHSNILSCEHKKEQLQTQKKKQEQKTLVKLEVQNTDTSKENKRKYIQKRLNAILQQDAKMEYYKNKYQLLFMVFIGSIIIAPFIFSLSIVRKEVLIACWMCILIGLVLFWRKYSSEQSEYIYSIRKRLELEYEQNNTFV